MKHPSDVPRKRFELGWLRAVVSHAIQKACNRNSTLELGGFRQDCYILQTNLYNFTML